MYDEISPLKNKKNDLSRTDRALKEGHTSNRTKIL